ncbi:hypothetical protein [Pedobacter sp. SYSU D00535]|uniref:hypothetical protein n=1 Tax=Pedobacter sp. SYSU D00535 TaxID=2810308 RepID=UPI001A964F42|nr:hypothetical protein [Pedobacter sp. SYSU D00535]
MFQLSTHDLSQIFLENSIDEPSCKLSEDDEAFYSSIQEELNKEIRQPHPLTIERILTYSKRLSE